MKPNFINISRFFLFVTLLSVQFLFGQNVKSEVAKINLTFKALKKYSTEVEYIYYVEGPKGKIISPNVTIYKKDGDNLFVKQLHSETILNKNFAINIDLQNKFIIVSNREKAPTKKIKTLQEELYSRLDSIMTIYEKTELQKKNNGMNEITFWFKKGGTIKNIIVTYNCNSYIISGIKANYSKAIEQQGEKYIASEIKYRNFNSDVSFSKTTFSESNYIVFTKKKIVPSKTYSDFQLINKLIQKS